MELGHMEVEHEAEGEQLELGKVLLDLETSRDGSPHDVFERLRQVSEYLETQEKVSWHHAIDEKIGEEKSSSDISSHFTKELHQVNASIDHVYTKWSSYPSNPGQEKCGKYLKTGTCSFGAKCKFDHPFHEPISATVENDLLLFLTFITERLMKILKTFSYEAAVDVLSSLCKIVDLLESYYDIALTHPSYGQICYLYGDVVIRLSVDIDKFCSNKLSQKRTTPRFKRKGPQFPDSNFQVFEDCAERLEALNQKWLDWEEAIRRETLTQLEENDPAVSHITTHLSNTILNYARETLAHFESMKHVRETLQTHLLSVFRQTWPDVELVPFGSHANFLGSANSDMDLTLQYQGEASPGDVLDSAGKLAEAAGYTLREVIKETRVPVLKLYDQSTHIEIDIVVNNNLAIYNTTLLRNYAFADPRVRPLILTIKLWAQCRGCNNPRNATLSSYAWTLMVLFFLMTHPTEKPLPSIEDVGKIVQDKELTIETLKDDLDDLDALYTTSIGKLFIQFFAFYGTCSPQGFQPFHSIVSLRNTFRVYKKSSHLHTGARVKSVGDVLDDHLGLLKAATAVKSELIGEVDTSRLEANDISNMVVYSISPSWRFCIEDPYEEHDLGKVIYSLTGQIHIMDELKRCLTLFNDLVVKHRFHFRDVSHDSSLVPDDFNFWIILSRINDSVPRAIKTCSICGQEGHFSKECDLIRCHLCNEKGHFMKDCIRLFCSNCRQQGHFAKDCKKERVCRYCKQPGHEVKDCPFKTCTKCGSKSHTTFRCKIRLADTAPTNANAANPIAHAPSQSSEQKLIAPTVYSSPDVPKSLPRRGKVPPLPLEAKKSSLAKLSGIGPSIKIIPPDSPVILSSNEAMDSPLPPSDSKVTYDPQQLSPAVTEEMPSPDIQPAENKDAGRKKKKRKPRNKVNQLKDRNEVVASPDLTGFEVQKSRTMTLDTSSASSSPREALHRKKLEESSPPHGPSTSERIAHAIRNPTPRTASLDDKKDIKTSLHFESETVNTREMGDSKFDETSSQPDLKMAAPKVDHADLRRSQSKNLHRSHSNGSKYIALTRPPSLIMSHRSHIDASCSELSDFSADSPTPRSPIQVRESKKVLKEMKESKNGPESLVDGAATHRQRVIMKRESKIVETKITDA